MARARRWSDVRAEARAMGRLDEARMAELQRRMLAEVRIYPMIEFRETLGLSQADVANLIGASVSDVSRIERGDLDHTHMEIATVRAYVGALGGEVEIVARFGDERITIG
jgi:ribosome-binding protein aMBF1 (putative translation factor)